MPHLFLVDAAIDVLLCKDSVAKARLGQETAARFAAGALAYGSAARGADGRPVPDRPGRPDKPQLCPPRQVKRRRITSGTSGRIALLHALAHIELNAIDLAWDMVARFDGEALPANFYRDWVRVADEEATHFLLLNDRLKGLGASYGDLPAHDGLWEAAEATAHDLLARLAVVPMVLEARGLDVTPDMIAKLEGVGDQDSAAILKVILRDEIGHVAIGHRWFCFFCERAGQDPAASWHKLVRTYFKGVLKPPFNDEARAAAGMPESFYGPMARDSIGGPSQTGQ